MTWTACVNFGHNQETSWELGASDNLVDYLESVVKHCRESKEEIQLNNINRITFTQK